MAALVGAVLLVACILARIAYLSAEGQSSPIEEADPQSLKTLQGVSVQQRLQQPWNTGSAEPRNDPENHHG